MQRDRLSYLLIPLAALLVILPLMWNGCSCGHDFDFHLLSWMEAARQFTHGHLHPHWAYTPAYNAGEPRFVFYPPLSWTIGALLGLILPWNWTPIAYTWLALTMCGFGLHRLVRDFATPTVALLVSVFYLANPYMLFTAYERTAYAELLAAAWIPLLLHGILRREITIPRIALPVALLWITNAPAAVMSCYALALLAIVRLVAAKPATKSGGPSFVALSQRVGYSPCTPSSARPLRLRWASRDSATAPAHSPFQTNLRQAQSILSGALLGLGLAAFYIVPAAWERRFVQIAMAILPGMRIQDSFLFHHTGDIPHDEVLHTVSLVAVILLAATVIVLALLRLPRTSHASPLWRDDEEATRQRLFPPLLALTVAIALLLTPVTAFLWNHLPELAFLQFPWRLLALLAAVLSLALALALPSLILKPAATAVLALALAASLTYPAYTVFQQDCDPGEDVSSRLALFRSSQGVEPTDEYTPTTADNDVLAHANPAFWLSPDPDAKAPAHAIPGPVPAHLTINAPSPETLILNLRDYPSWRVTLNGSPVSGRGQRDDGLIAIPIPAGPSTVAIAYTQTPDQTLGDAITLASLVLLFLLLNPRSKEKPSN